MKTKNTHSYEVDLRWEEAKTGILYSQELEQEVKVATPPPFDGGVQGVWSPEHLFVASVSSCFMTTFTAIAQYSKLEFEDLNVHAEGCLGKKDGKFVVTEILLEPKLIITDEKFVDKAKRIMKKAEEACLITRSINTKIIFKPQVEVGELT